MSAEAKFTPGPWYIGELPYFHVRAEREPVGETVFASDYAPPDNAHLIAAAPELYVALDDLVRTYTDEPETGEWSIDLRPAQAALAKARGEQA